MLYIVSTPIGNLKDITLRALEVLKTVDLIACEDTRHTRILLDHYQIKKPLTSYHSYNKSSKTQEIIKLLQEGKNIALVSDAGTPGISDPGVVLVNQAIKDNIPFTVIPGPSGLISGLVLSGLPTHKFVFEGFLPVKQAARIRRLKELKPEKRTIIIYESPHRLIRCLEDMLQVLGDIEIACLREVTKKFEEARRAEVAQVLGHFKKIAPKGEFILVLNLYLTNKK
ncbi:MAG: 16S rRNA (cytidine(1402)-2'-O)-methyltransferase [Omnitrophica WOR_2 bacterium RIFCSPLOWO2_01_FULL_41_12]|nr:MAG: 16S rRNA (cytidine(1402)-2'-O)-methyltransferase [Omnitrophica WOR_2 bacterium RIFCSPLOWO2_01_FULL_41_12]